MKRIILILAAAITLYAFEDLTDDNKPVTIDVTDNKPVTIDATVDLDNLHKAYDNNTNDAVVVYMYEPRNLMKIRTRIMTKTTVLLPNGDVPVGNVSGSSKAFTIKYLKNTPAKFDLSNAFVISTAFVGTDTTLTIFGKSGRIYNFYLYSIGTDSEEIPNTMVYITKNGTLPDEVERINQDEKDKEIIKQQNEINALKEKLDIKIEKFTKNLKNFNIASIQLDYEFNKELELEAVFNDDEFTYFKFNKNSDIPKFYYIDEKQDKIMMNFIRFENIIKVNKLSKNWNLELNDDVLSVDKIGSFEIEYSNKKLYVDMTKTRYTSEITCDNDIAPEIVFYDHRFTYFKFDMSNGFKKFPIMFAVVDGYNQPVDTEIINNYIVVKELHKKYAYRLGELKGCARIEID
ncbi:MAG: hypothetical protein DRG78_00755 [Epsilonproteobacteria bacterium]|nr:MAG: hypothetical protein DRG78_00755 [Campylobacterota bacterium]